MAIVKQEKGTKGSLKNIQHLVNVPEYRELLDRKLKEAFQLEQNCTIEWLSPLASENYSEYKDQDFIKRLGLDSDKIKIEEFWAKKGGAQWDALAKVKETGDIFLIEAKANIPEMVSPATEAKEPSLTKIREALQKTKDFLGVKNDIDWSGKFYQYTNRLAHLYFLREEKEQKANLVFIYFYNDPIANSPTSIEEWKSAILVMKLYLGLGQRNKLSKWTKDIFIDVKDIGLKQNVFDR